MKLTETNSCESLDVLDEDLMEELNNIRPKEALYPQEKVLFSRGCDGSCTGCSSCTGAEGIGW